MPVQESEGISVTPIIIKKKIVHAGHHSGAWRVAYANFVTAMMALFIVLWLMGTSDPVKKAVPAISKIPPPGARKNGTGEAGSGENLSLGKDDMDN
jgi:chemotaxis protein MotB